MKTKIYTLLAGLVLITGFTFAQTARVQIIHNSADAAASPVDIYVNGTLAFDDVPFRAATPFTTVPAGVTLSVGVAPGNSTSVNDTIVNFNVTFSNNETYVVVADGIVSPTGYSPSQPFGLSVYGMGRETASNTLNTDVLVHHGSTDAPTVDVYETGVGAGLIVDDLAYTDFAGYLELPTADYTLEIRDQTGMTTVATYSAPLSTLNLGGEALVVVASGFLNPANNSNGPAFGLYVALASGGALVALPEVQTARVQIIHNSADAAASPVDIYVEGALAFDDVPFRAATAFTTVPAGVTLNVGIAPGNSTSVNDTIVNFPVTFANNETYVVVADGIVSPTGYSPAQPFGLAVYGMGREMASNSMNTDVLVHHGSTDAPTVDVYETGVGAGLIVDDLAYTDFAGYLELPTADYTLEIRDETGTTTVASYEAPLSTLGLDGQALVVVASGFLDPTNNSNGPAFGLYVALAAGGPLVALPVSTPNSVSEVNATTVKMYPNPATDIVRIEGVDLTTVNVSLYDMAGRNIANALQINGNSLDISKLENGMYQMVLINSEEEVTTLKLVKN
jgi:hypothetical protein